MRKVIKRNDTVRHVGRIVSANAGTLVAFGRRAPARLSDAAAGTPRADAVISAPPGEWITHLTAKNGDEWFGGARGIARLRQARPAFLSTNQLGPEEVFAFAEAPDGRLWCSTPRKVWEFDGKNWLTLRGGFDQINALHCAGRNALGATTNGLYRYAAGAWLANGPEDGLPARTSAGLKKIPVVASLPKRQRAGARFSPRLISLRRARKSPPMRPARCGFAKGRC